jgi:hypothetical protein
MNFQMPEVQVQSTKPGSGLGAPVQYRERWQRFAFPHFAINTPRLSGNASCRQVHTLKFFAVAPLRRCAPQLVTHAVKAVLANLDNHFGLFL